MSKVIGIRSREEFDTSTLPTKAEGEALLNHLYYFRPFGKEPSREMIRLVSDLIQLIESNTGGSKFEALKTHLEEKKAQNGLTKLVK